MWRSRWNTNNASGRVATQLFDSTVLNAPVGARNAGNLKELRTRIAAIKNIRKITSSMKLVASSKLAKAQSRLDKVKPFVSSAMRLWDIEYPATPLGPDGKEPELNEFQIEALQKMPGKHLIVTITSDRGLCGGVNGSIVRAAKKLAAINPPSTSLILLGDKSTAGLTKEFAENFIFTVSSISGNTTTSYTEIAQIADSIIRQQFERITVLHNHFITVLSFSTRRRIFPSKESFLDKKKFVEYEFEDTREEDLEDYYAFTFGNFLYGSIIEAHATELSARMRSMDNATTNASDVLNRLSIKYNKQRQAIITTELVEIVSGAAAIESQDGKD